MASDKTRRLQELRGSDFEITEGQPDIRDWEIIDPQGRKLGRVSDLILDSRARRIRYMVMKVSDSKELDLDKRTVLVPIGLAQLDTVEDIVVLHNVNPFQLRALPQYNEDDLGPKAERSISTVFGRTHTMADTQSMEADVDETFYEDELYNENNLHKSRRNKTGMAAAAGNKMFDKTGDETINESYREKTPKIKDALKDEDDVRALEKDLDQAEQKEKEKLYSRHEETTPVSYRDRGDAGAVDRDRDLDDRRETEEEYIRRKRRDFDNS
jgi:sporulation protein YlmC with PRC-barrel domain